MKLFKSAIILMAVIFFSGCKTSDLKPVSEYAITPIQDPIRIVPTGFDEAFFAYEQYDLDTNKMTSKQRLNYSATSKENGIDYVISTYFEGNKVDLNIEYDSNTNKAKSSSIDSDDKKLVRFMHESGIADMLVDSLPVRYYQTDLVSGKAFSFDASSQAERTMDGMLSMSNETVDFLIKEASVRSEVLGTSVVEGRKAVAISSNATIKIDLRDGHQRGTMTATANGLEYLDINTGLLLRSDQYSYMSFGGNDIKKERTLTRFVRFN